MRWPTVQSAVDSVVSSGTEDDRVSDVWERLRSMGELRRVAKKKSAKRSGAKRKRSSVTSIGCPCSSLDETDRFERACWCEGAKAASYDASAGTSVVVLDCFQTNDYSKSDVAFALLPDGRIAWFWKDELVQKNSSGTLLGSLLSEGSR